MRKFWFWCLPVFCGILIFAGLVIRFSFASQSNIYATKFQFRYEKLQLVANRTYKLTKNEFVIEPKTCTENFLISTNENTIIEVDSSTNEIVTKECGSCEITAMIKSSASTMLSVAIPVEVVDESEASITNVITENISFSLDDGILAINLSNYFSEPAISYQIVSGSTLIESVELEFNRLILSFSSTGTVEVDVKSASTKIRFVIEIE